jgi:putative phage-type endonuclease
VKKKGVTMPLTPEQIALRRTGIAASEVAAVAGLNPYLKPIDVWSAKLGLVEPFEGNKSSKWGDLLEQVIADHYGKEHAAEKIVVRHPKVIEGSVNGTLVREISPRFRLIATPDRLVYRKRMPQPFRNLQIKTAGLRQEDAWGEPGTDQVPEHYLIQVAAEMAVIGVDETDLAVLIGGQDDREYRIKRDMELEGQLIEICERFWVDHILTQTPPPVDGSENYSDYLKRRFPRDVRPMLPATEEAIGLLSELRSARASKESFEKHEAGLVNTLKALISDAGGIEGICTWKANRPSVVVDWERAFRSLSKVRLADGTIFRYSPDLVEAAQKFTTTKPGARPFKLAKEK